MKEKLFGYAVSIAGGALLASTVFQANLQQAITASFTSLSLSAVFINKKDDRIETLVQKYVTKNATPEEIEELDQVFDTFQEERKWIELEQNEGEN